MANSSDAIDCLVQAVMKARPWILPAGPFPGIPNLPDPKIKLVFVDSRFTNLVLPLRSTQKDSSDVAKKAKAQKSTFHAPIMPTIHPGFSFSITHFLSAIRLAMICPLPEYYLEKGRQEGNANGVTSNGNSDANKSCHSVQANVPSLTVQEIVNLVRLNPGDPCILETQEPLQDLVRGVLKIFSSKIAPLGAKGWKALVSYENSTKSWSWIGPVSQTSTDQETIKEVTSVDYWGLPHKMLVKLVDSFANWLKSGREIFQQIRSLPAPPTSLMHCDVDEKERFKDLRAHKSLNSLSLSSEEVREYFHKEEVLRYSIPDRAFSYTAADGTKSIVAPLRRCAGKPSSKARGHFILKCDRPPHVTILCLVRDAASRLPESIGTRADVCTLVRDSQYIVEDVSDAQVNRVVSRALDRLHYERDPCVQFDGERKLWVYMHKYREEEDFEDDGTSSTKKMKRKKKDPVAQPGQPDQGPISDSFANLLKGGQETIQQIASLPAPSLSLMQSNLDEKEGFKDLRAQKSLNTIIPSSEEVREYFQKEEVLRYSIPDKAFPYRATDGKKSIVAPLRKFAGKPTSKALDHFMLKCDRPPHVNVLCLVRDAVSRLPEGTGTITDVCTLIRDSQYIVEDVSDAQVNQVVCRALYRLSYEQDPCVQFDKERKLWVYLHRDREEDAFEEDGISSTKKWKRQRKDPVKQPYQPDQGAESVAFHLTDQSRLGLGSDLNPEPPRAGKDNRTNPVSNDVKQTVKDNAETGSTLNLVNSHQATPMVWDAVNLTPQ